MILFVGNSIKLGGLAEVMLNRLNEQIEYLPEYFDIRKQENDILHTAKEAGYILYDCREYYNDGKEIADTIKRIYRTNKAVPILVLDTDNPGNEIVKECLAQQIRNFINAGLSLSMQKDQLEKILVGYYENNKREDLEAAEEIITEENKTVNEFVQNLYDAKQREEEKERTVIIKKKGNGEVAIDTVKGIIRAIFTVISIVLMSLAVITLIYDEPRRALFKVLNEILLEIQNMI